MAVMTSEATRESASDVDLDAVLADGVRSVYQPIVDLDTGGVVGYEALARGPVGSSLESPGALFHAARAQGRVKELDGACWTAALRGAMQASLSPPMAVFVNVEPQVMGTGLDNAGRRVVEDARRRLKIFFEVTERALTDRPAQLLDFVARMRSSGFAIALDDVGADRRSLALLPLLRPDVVKLDISLIHNHPSRRSGEVMNGVCAYAEQTGAVILAEGIETEAHLLAARSLGATLAQGWYFGRPGPLPATHPHPEAAAVTVRTVPQLLSSSPVELVHARRALKIGRKDVLLSVTRALEAKALQLGEHAVVAGTFQHFRHFTPYTRARYDRLGAQTSLAVALGAGMPDPPATGVRGVDLAPDDPLVGEWDVAVLGPHYAGALVARDLGDSGPDHERRFEFVLTFERELVVDVAAALIGRVRSPAPETPHPSI
jgi:EAL domain-containing protein (putative c-di-GMP-specific phosphodiesterase class I)/DICT domain-containing protein